MSNEYPLAYDIPEAVVCGVCGHPIWDQRVNPTCEECESRERATACSLFLLNEFKSNESGPAN